MTSLFNELKQGESSVSIKGAEWLQLKFGNFQLGIGGKLTISTAAGQSQTFSQDQLENWKGLTAIFNGSELTIALAPSENAADNGNEISATIEEIIIGLPGQKVEAAVSSAPKPLRDLLGDDLNRYIPHDPPRQPEVRRTESRCGPNDDRVASNHLLTGRIMPIGCTGWIIQGGALLTAGHCIGPSTQTIEFNVPASKPDSTTVSPEIRDQYRVIDSSIVHADNGTGDDWAIFEVLPNTETGLTPITAQKGAFHLSNTANPSDVRITGFGVDDGSANQTQQTHVGALTDHQVGGLNSATLRYSVDTEGGNSGSPVILEGGGQVAIGIHTNAGCSAIGGSNAGTSFRNQGLWAAINNGVPPSFITSRWADWTTYGAMKVLAGDFNGDGKTDVMKFDVPGSGSGSGSYGLWVGLAPSSQENLALSPEANAHVFRVQGGR